MSYELAICSRVRQVIRISSALTVAAVGAAQAASEAPGYLEFVQSDAPTVEVRSTNGELYNEVVAGRQIGTTVSGACEVDKRGRSHDVESVELTAAGWPGQTSNAYLHSLAHHANYLPATEVRFPDGIYPTGVSYPATWKQRAIEACNMNLNHQIDHKGMKKGQVLGKPWHLHDVSLDKLEATLACGEVDTGVFVDPGKIYQATLSAKINVHCQKYALDQVQAEPESPTLPTGPNDVKLKVGVTQAAVAIVPNVYQGVCPTELNASGTIVTNGPATVRYRLEDDKGQRSTVGMLRVDQTNTAYFVVKLAIGRPVSADPGNTFSAAQSGSGGGSTNPSSTLASQTPPANVHQGFYRLITVSPNEVVSQPSNFKVICNPAASQQLTAPALPQGRQPSVPQRQQPSALQGRQKPPTERKIEVHKDKNN
jgi:hypothetical protein